MKAIVLFSGGLDSILATLVLKEQGVEVVGLNMRTPFHDCSRDSIAWAEELGIELVVREFGGDGEEYMRMLVDPRWGYGANVNPCLDCRTAMCREAKKLMEEIGADFVATGEISGQRPNSQKMHQLALISRESGLEGKLLRPLCAKVLNPTDVELDGSIDREKLRSFTGRSRGSLVRLAREKYGIKRIPQPSTGCVLCENSFAPRIWDLLKHKKNPTVWDAKLLFCGRRLRLDENAYCVVGRKSADCDALDEAFASPKRSRCVLLYPGNYMGASVLLVTDEAPEFGDENAEISPKLAEYVETAGSLALRFANPAKYRATGGPTTLLKFGALEREIPIFENPAVDEIPIIIEAEKKKTDENAETESKNDDSDENPENARKINLDADDFYGEED